MDQKYQYTTPEDKYLSGNQYQNQVLKALEAINNNLLRISDSLDKDFLKQFKSTLAGISTGLEEISKNQKQEANNE